MQPQLTTKEGNVIPLNDDVYEEILRMVARRGRRERPRSGGDITKFFGMFNSGDADSADNEQIDIDLGNEYGNSHGD